MENKKRRNLWIVCPCIVIGLLAIVALTINLTSRKGMVSEEDAVAAIQSEFNILIGSEQEIVSPLISLLEDGFEVHITSIDKIDGKTYSIACELSNYNVINGFNKMTEIGGDMSLNEYSSSLIEYIRQQPKTVTNVEIKLSKNEQGEYVASFTEEQLNYAVGGLITYYAEILGKGQE